MVCAVSTACLYPLETEKALEILLNFGFKEFEIFANCESEFSDEFIGLLKKKLRSFDAKVYSVHLFTSGFEPFLFFSNYPRRFNDSIAKYSRFFSQAARLGAKVVVFHGDRKGGSLPIEEYCLRYKALFDAAAREGVILAQENVARCRSGSVETILSMKRILGGDVKFVLDVKQALRAGVTPFEMCDAIGENIVLVHLSDSTDEHDCLLPGNGIFDINKLCKKLKICNYAGPLVIEVYRDSYKKYEDISLARKFLLSNVKNIT